jgi:photosystem II stability/assembly factor-like uncharacterized protein
VTPPETVANAIVILSGTKSARILTGTEAQGILRSDDGANFSATSNDGFSHRIIESLAADPQNASHLLVRIAGLPNRLFASRDAGMTWAEFPAVPPAKSLVGLYGTKSGWWISFADGGLAQFDSTAGKWRLATFREMLPRAIAQKSAGSRNSNRAVTALRIVSPRVFWLYESSDRVLAASDDGLWIRKSREMQFRKIQSKNLPGPVSHVSVASGNSLFAIAGNSIWKSDFDATVWSALPAPQSSGRLLWIQEDSHAATSQWLVGTELGVFASSGGPWHLLASGLPAIASVPLASSSEPLRLLAMNNGGIYESVDSGNTWGHVDSDAETGKVTAIISLAGLRFSIASQSEGLLVFSPVAQTER